MYDAILHPLNKEEDEDRNYDLDFITKDERKKHKDGKTASKEYETNEKEYKKAVKFVATAVSKKLGNTPTIALQSYINPATFAAWRAVA